VNFEPTAEQSAILDLAYEVGQSQIAPHARQWDADGSFPRSLWPELAGLGFGGLYVDSKVGGTGMSRLDGTLVFEGLSHSCASVAAFLSIHNMCAAMVGRHGTANVKARLLPDIIAMECILSYCLTEPGSGSDAAALRTRAKSVPRGWQLDGVKSFISGAGYSDAYIVMARTGASGPDGISAFLVEAGTSGLNFGALEDKMGWRSQPTRQVQLDACVVPNENLLGDVGQGFRYAMEGLDGGRLNIAACSLGAAQAALDQTSTYMSEREAFGRPIREFQALQFRLADKEIALHGARVVLRDAAWALDHGASDATKRCAMAKAFVTEVASQTADGCLQLHGGYGYLADYGIEKIVRDLRVHQIVEGTNEVMRLIVARNMLQT